MTSKDKLNSIFRETSGRSLDLKPSTRVRSMRVGEIDSVYGGEGIEFEEAREFQQGDSVRNIDARLSARMGRLIVAERTELREARAIIVFDLSSSMRLRDKTKIAFTAASMLMHSAYTLNMPFGLFTGGVEDNLSLYPKTGEEQLYRARNFLVESICSQDNTSGVFSPNFLRRLRPLFSEGSLIFIVSDFLGTDSENVASQILREGVRADIIPIIVQDDLEYSFPLEFASWGSSIRLYDVNIESDIDFWLNRENAAKKRQENEERFSALRQLFRSRSASYVHLDSHDIHDIFSKMRRI